MQIRTGLRLLPPSLFVLLLTACGGGDGGDEGDDGGGPAGRLQPGTLQFSEASGGVDESAGTVTLTIVRTAGSDGAVSVTLATRDASAIAGQDYTAVNRVVNFAAGDTASKTVTLPIADDAQGEAEETFTATLASPTGGATVGAVATATLTVRDNDPPSPATLEVGSNLRQLLFSWTTVPGATSYRLLRDPNGTSGFTPVGIDLAANVTSANVEVAVHKHDWVNARYRLQACNTHGCAASAAISATNAMLGAIGYFKASNTAADQVFGYAVAMSADGLTLAVSAPSESNAAMDVNGDPNAGLALNSGAVYVFSKSAGQWAQRAYIKASNTDPADRFGGALALSADGSTLAVGAQYEDSSSPDIGGDQGNQGDDNYGAVYVFSSTAGNWSQQAYVKASTPSQDDFFGSAVALSANGNTLAVAALGEDSAATNVDGDQNDETADNAGAVYVFTRVAADWSQQAYLKAFLSESRDHFGSALALSADGSTLAIGATSEGSNATGINGDQSNNNSIDSGAVYMFQRSGGQWTTHDYIKPSNTISNGPGNFTAYRFGGALSLDADGMTLAVGAAREASNGRGVDGNENDNSLPRVGAVYVFARGNDHWAQLAYVKPTDTPSADSFGEQVALSADGGTLAIGSRYEDSGSRGVGGDGEGDSDENGVITTSSGAVYVYERIGTQWSATRLVKSSNSQDGDEFGSSLALSADGATLAAGAHKESGSATGVGGDQADNSAVRAGAVYLY